MTLAPAATWAAQPSRTGTPVTRCVTATARPNTAKAHADRALQPVRDDRRLRADEQVDALGGDAEPEHKAERVRPPRGRERPRRCERRQRDGEPQEKQHHRGSVRLQVDVPGAHRQGRHGGEQVRRERRRGARGAACRSHRSASPLRTKSGPRTQISP